jgi:tRNA1Val (adenine37-N6)-methyltransferase
LIDKPIIALLAGSRRQEIKDNLPTMLKAVAAFPDYQAVIAGAPGIDADLYRHCGLDPQAPVPVVFGQTYRLLQQSHAALVTSGTATLETALLRVPQAVCYKTPTALKHAVTYVFKHWFVCKYISLVNLIANKTVVKELFGNTFSTEKVRNELGLLLNDATYRQQMEKDYDNVIKKSGAAGASEQAAKSCLSWLKAFRFKQFSVQHDLCAMKVGTDGVLLGAWTDVSEARTILDVGSGSGLIALMLAQRSRASIDAIDVDWNACRQAEINFANAPFSHLMRIIHSNLKDYFPDLKYDLIVSNPPYFVNSLKSPDAGRSIARHTDDLNFEDLIAHSSRLLSEKGKLSLILPADTCDTIQTLAKKHSLFLTRKTLIRPTADRPPKRILLEFSAENCPLKNVTELFIEQSRHVYSAEYIALTGDFYLNF